MKEKTLHRGDKLSSGGEKHSLILYNDEINTFDHVIKSLVEICGHDSVQAEQCALIVHLKGSCEIKSGYQGGSAGYEQIAQFKRVEFPSAKVYKVIPPIPLKGVLNIWIYKFPLKGFRDIFPL